MLLGYKCMWMNLTMCPFLLYYSFTQLSEWKSYPPFFNKPTAFKKKINVTSGFESCHSKGQTNSKVVLLTILICQIDWVKCKFSIMFYFYPYGITRIELFFSSIWSDYFLLIKGKRHSALVICSPHKINNIALTIHWNASLAFLSIHGSFPFSDRQFETQLIPLFSSNP